MQRNIKELYYSTFDKYRKYKTRYNNNLSTGRFYELSQRRQIEITTRLKKLYNRLKQLKLQLKLAAASGAITLALSTNPVQSQQLGPFVENEEANPIRSTEVGGQNKKITFADIDNDGDLDMAMGILEGTISYYENIGDVNHPRYIERTGTANPFDAISVPSGNAAPELIDFDDDGDMDLILGESDGYSTSGVNYFQNNDMDDGILGNDPNFTLLTATTTPVSPINNVSASKYDVKPVVVDIDNDGDLDIFLGQDGGFPSYQSIIFYENNAGFSGQELPNGLGEFGFDTGSSNTTPTFFDYDGDGDFDLFIGASDGTIRYFNNVDLDPRDPTDVTIGDNISFSEETGSSNPFDGVDVGTYSVITFADLDGDGDGDAIIGQGSTSTAPEYYENTPNGFIEQTRLGNPFDAFDVTYDASPTFVDIDNDGDMDAIIGTKYRNDISFLRNDDGIFTDLTGSGTPFDGLSTGQQSSSPAFVQVDADADFDLYVGFYYDPAVKFYRNTGAVTAPNFNDQGAAFGISISFGSDSSPTFGDLNNDGVQDAIVGFDGQGQMRYFEGVSDAPTFTERIGASNPVDGFVVGTVGNFRQAKPDLVDLDHDGDLDLAIGVHAYSSESADGSIVYLQNNGSANFTEQTGIANPFDGIKAASIGFETGDSEPTFVDIDLDGDLDMFVGNADGRVQFFENQNTAPQVNSNASTASYTEDDAPTLLDATLALSDDGGDIDDNGDFIGGDDIISATVAITSGFITGQDVLSFNSQFGITGSFNNSTGILTLSGSASLTSYETALRSITYQNTSQNPTESPRSIRFLATDFDATNPSEDLTITVSVNAVNDAPVLSNSVGNTIFTEDEGAVIIDSGISISDVDNTNIESATITVDGNFISTEDVLSFTNQNGITGSYDGTTGILSLSGSASVADYESALQSITYINTSDNPTVATRSIEFIINDGADPSNIISKGVDIVPVNDAPIVTTSASNTIFNKDEGATIIDNSIIISDLDDVDIESATISITTNFTSAEDVLAFTDQSDIVGSFNATTGILSLTGTSSISNYEDALRSITYENVSNNPTIVTRSIEFTVNDGTDPSNIASKNIDVAPVNNPPILSSTNTDNLDYVQNSSAIIIDDLLDISDVDDTDFSGATIEINGFQSGDNLLFTDQNGISGVFNNGVLILNGQASEANYEMALQSIQFESSNIPDSRAIEFIVRDDTDESTPYIRNITIQDPLNQPPIVDTTPASTQTGSVVTIDLCAIISDPDNEFDELAISVTNTLSNASTSIDDCTLTVDYGDTSFSGQDEIIIQACDPSGNCDENTLNIDVEEFTEVNIYNAVSPNGRDGNDWWIIEGISTPNSIKLYNRWGDVVKTLNNYNGSPNVPNNELDDLPSATYFYEINSSEGSFKGYIVVKK